MHVCMYTVGIFILLQKIAHVACTNNALEI